MPLGTLWIITLETSEPIGDVFIDGIISDGVGQNENGKDIIKNIKISCLKELTDEEYREHDVETKKYEKEHGITHFKV